MECVSEPELHSADEAVGYLEALRRTLQQLGVSDVKMEEGSLRCDANVSVRPVGSEKLGTKTEIKNMNSFRSVHRAIESEIERQIALLEKGERIVQETRGWDELRGVTRVDAQQGRGARLPLLSRSRSRAARRLRAASSSGCAKRCRSCRSIASSATRANSVSTPSRQRSWSTMRRSPHSSMPSSKRAKARNKRRTSSSAISRDWRTRPATPVYASPVTPEHLAELIVLVETQDDQFEDRQRPCRRGCGTARARPRRSSNAKGSRRPAIPRRVERFIDQVLAANEKSVSDYRAGKTNVMGFLVGQVMKASAGKADPQLVNSLMKQKLGA